VYKIRVCNPLQTAITFFTENQFKTSNHTHTRGQGHMSSPPQPPPHTTTRLRAQTPAAAAASMWDAHRCCCACGECCRKIRKGLLRIHARRLLFWHAFNSAHHWPAPGKCSARLQRDLRLSACRRARALLCARRVTLPLQHADEALVQSICAEFDGFNSLVVDASIGHAGRPPHNCLLPLLLLSAAPCVCCRFPRGQA